MLLTQKSGSIFEKVNFLNEKNFHEYVRDFTIVFYYLPCN